MLSSLLFILCVALSTCLIWYCLWQRLRAGIGRLGNGLLRCRRYFSVPLTAIREKALRRRTLLLLRQLAVVMFYLGAGVLFYGPSMLFAHYRSSLSAAFLSPEALIGMLAGALAIGAGKLRK